MSEIRHVPSDGGVVNVHEEIVLVHVHGELEPLDQLLVAHQVVEEPAGEVPHCLAVLRPHLNIDWPCAGLSSPQQKTYNLSHPKKP